MPGASSQMAPLAKRLAERGEAVLVDLPDCGRAPDDPSTDPDHAVDDVRAVITSLAPMPVTLVGLSFGAWTAGRLASTAPPPNLVSLALLGGYARFPEKDVAPFEQLAAEIAANRISIAALVDIALARWFPSGASDAASAHVRELVSSLSRDRLVRALQRLNATARSDRLVGASELPAVIVHARGDVAVPLEATEDLTSRLPRAAMTVLDTDSHYITWTHTDECVAAICGAHT